MSGPGSSSLPRLGPTWSQGGRGFQPPPPVPAERARTRSSSAGSIGSETKPNVNKFSVLDDDDDLIAAGNGEKRPSNSRSEALRSFQRTSSGGPKPAGRSLADLAARTPATSRPSSASEGGGRVSASGDSSKDISSPKVVRFTRERLLSMRPSPKPDTESPPPYLKQFEGSVILTMEPQDPVCWDSFEPDEIWATVSRERVGRSNSIGEAPPPPKGRIGGPRGLAEPSDDKRRPTSTAPGGGRWQRGVALPPPDDGTNRGRHEDAENPNELWDDPVSGATGAAADFSAFGEIPDDPKGGGDAFDFDKMAEASRRFEMERHGSKTSDMTSEDEDNAVHSVQVDPHRPLASAGTTIQSGSGDNVNVFEDFDETVDESNGSDLVVKDGAVDASASSRLMKMIGVNSDAAKDAADSSDTKQIHSWGMGEKSTDVQDSKLAAIPSNPWGTAIGADANQQQVGLDLSSRLEAVVVEQKAREAQIAAELERRRRQQEEEEVKRRALRAQQEQAEAASAQQQVGPSQVELVLMERISTFLENSWGRSDLLSILSTLHAEDSRVIPLLGNVDSLRALIARHPNRIGLRQDPAFGTEMAVLLLTNAQWQRVREEEFQLAKQQRRQEAMRQAAAQQKPRISADAPWFYSDPQNNIQGPFRGEEMRQWLEAGYFKGDLPISQQPTGPFVPLQAFFPDLVIAFKAPGTDAAAEAAAAEEEKRAREAEEERLALERAQAKAASEREHMERERAERERREREAAGKKQSAESAQLKMMLGLAQSGGANETDVQELADETTPSKKNGRGGQSEKVQLKSSKQQQRQQTVVAAAAGKASPVGSPAAPAAWGSTAASAAPRKSISEIQQEEARAAARLAMERQNIPRSSGGWANVAASKGGSTGWTSGMVKMTTPATVLTNPNVAGVVVRRPSPPGNQQQSSAVAQRPRSENEVSDDNFGASMPPALENWCKEQMKKLNGSDDLTLVSFCMTLTDADEIRQYLTAYLGSTPQVNNFATEFINRKSGGKGREEWEAAGKGKKGKKKK